MAPHKQKNARTLKQRPSNVKKVSTQVKSKKDIPLSKRKDTKRERLEEINRLLRCWLDDASNRFVKITGRMIQEKAREFAEDLGIPTFVASNGWLQAFVERRYIASGKPCGEARDAADVVAAGKDRLPEQNKSCDKRHTFNKDQSGQFFKTSGHESFCQKQEETDIPERLNPASRTIAGPDFAELPTTDGNTNIYVKEEVDRSERANDLPTYSRVKKEVNNEENEANLDKHSEKTTIQEVLSALKTCSNFIQQHGSSVALQRLTAVKEEIVEFKRQQQQPRITNYFRKA
ncbi:tigger transposable element-derived protein 2 [Elysia marginata]|uniref:Tigger transposable element-derived protein 2 n=1 Tax=Elysia marginata TaxID=1093978 RepID=A0AAV4HKE4_9GAST|nr:tigger transposable element-derived protein 2 [Elysia marginata]